MGNVHPPQRRKHDTLASPTSFLLSTRPFAPTAAHPSSSLLPKDQPTSPVQVKGFSYSFEHMAVHHPEPAAVEAESVAHGETTNSSPRQLASDGESLIEQDQSIPTARESTLPAHSSASALQRRTTSASNPDTPKPPPVNRQAGAKRSGWSIEHMAITHNHPPPDQRTAANDAPTTRESSPQTEVLQQVAAEPDLPRENTTGLPDHLKTGVENLSGLSLDDVHVHYNSSKPAQVDALAYTQGTEIHVGPGQEQHLAHEAWHVIQQKEGRVQPTEQVKGTAINDDVGLEKEADVMGERADSQKGQRQATEDPEFVPISPHPVTQGYSMQTVQRYTTNTEGNKVSQNGQLLVTGDGSALYATQAQINQANSIGGEVEFYAGPPLPLSRRRKFKRQINKVLAFFAKPFKKQVAQGNDLFLVGVRASGDTTLAQNIADYKEADEIEALNARLRTNVKDYYNRTVYNNLYEKFLEIAEKRNISDADDIADELAERIVRETVKLDIPDVRRIVQEYLAQQQIPQHRPLLPSDCRALATYIAGFSAEAGTNVDDVAPGDIYRYTQLEDDANAEWGFHYAAVIMVDGNDHVTLENAAARVSDKFSKLPYDRTWYFEMYGAGQSFEGKYAPAFNNQGDVTRYRKGNDA